MMAGFAVILTALSLGLGLSRQPYVGVACRQANSTTCGRVGIAVWLGRRHAVRVEATLAGARVVMAAPKTPSAFWVGFVRLPLRSMGVPQSWSGSPAKRLTLSLQIRYRSGWRSGALRVELRPGWG
jgi:hypothetical protein